MRTTDKAESDLAVAAASTVARAEFLLRLQHLSDEIGTTLPKGASPDVELAGRMIAKKHGRGTARISCRTTLQNNSACAGENRLDRLSDLKDRRLIEIGAGRGFNRNLPTPVEHSTAVGAGMEISPAFDF